MYQYTHFVQSYTLKQIIGFLFSTITDPTMQGNEWKLNVSTYNELVCVPNDASAMFYSVG